MIDYIENPEKVTEHSINARKKIENHYNWDDRDDDFFKLISSISFSESFDKFSDIICITA